MFKLNTYLFNTRAQKYLSLTPREHRFVSYKKANRSFCCLKAIILRRIRIFMT